MAGGGDVRKSFWGGWGGCLSGFFAMAQTARRVADVESAGESAHSKDAKRLWRRNSWQSFFAFEIICFLHLEVFPVGFEAPFLGVGIGGDVCRGIVCDDVVEEIGGAGVLYLVGLAGRAHEAVAC